MLVRNGSTAQKKIVLQKMMVEYFSTSGGDFLPIHLKIAGLFALLHIAKISNTASQLLLHFRSCSTKQV